MSWITESLSEASNTRAALDASRCVLAPRIRQSESCDESNLRFSATAFEIAVTEALWSGVSEEEMRGVALQAFKLLRAMVLPADAMDVAEQLIRTCSYAVLADRGPDAGRMLRESGWPSLPIESEDWGEQTRAVVYDVWLRLFRKQGWSDLDEVQSSIIRLRKNQSTFEERFLNSTGSLGQARTKAWTLMALYHLARAAELLAIYTTQGHVEKSFDINEQLEAQFDRAIGICEKAELLQLFALSKVLSHAATRMVSNSIWTVTRAVNSRVTKFVHQLVSRSRMRPIFEVLPPQRRTLRDAGLLGSGFRSVVVSLPTSSGKTIIAQFRILQALNQFDEEAGWVAYLAPTRALVNQICSKLRSDFAPLGVSVERISPALEIDGLEERLLTDGNKADQFRVLVTTPEKLDLVLRGGWEERIGRPLTLVVVDEAHNLGQPPRGIKLELLLATINRECKNAQFLLLTPFIGNAKEIANWLSPNNSAEIDIGIEWQPNDRAIALCRATRGEKRGEYGLALETLSTTRDTISVPERLMLPSISSPGLRYSDVSSGKGKLAAVIAGALAERGPVILLARTVPSTWEIARELSEMFGELISADEDVMFVQRYCAAEFGAGFPLVDLLGCGIAVHHSGLPDDARALLEWLFERGKLRVMVATTTIAQGVNFPISAVVLAAHQYPGPPPQDMSPEEFWNLAGRAGRVDQGSLGLVVFASRSDEEDAKLRAFVGRQVELLNSTLIEMVSAAIQKSAELELHRLFNQPEWSSFLQYLAHTYREINDAGRFSSEIELILRGTLGFQKLRRAEPAHAELLVRSVHRYAERIAGKSLKLVDTTGFSWESVSVALTGISEGRVSADVWNTDTLFVRGNPKLKVLMGILLSIPELRTNLEDATGGYGPDGQKLANMVTDWVSGASIPLLAKTYFARSVNGEIVNDEKAISDCCRAVYGRLSITAAWGLAALQAMTLGEEFDQMGAADRVTLRNIPARVFYGVKSDEAIALRMVGVPREAAENLAARIGRASMSAPKDLRKNLFDGGEALWSNALGHRGIDYFRAWKLFEGIEH